MRDFAPQRIAPLSVAMAITLLETRPGPIQRTNGCSPNQVDTHTHTHARTHARTHKRTHAHTHTKVSKGKGLRSAIAGHDPPADVRQVSERHFATQACASGNHTSTQAGPEIWEEQPIGAPLGVGIKPRQADAGRGSPTWSQRC